MLPGRFFSMWDILAYWLAISVGAVVDFGLRPPIQSGTSLGRGTFEIFDCPMCDISSKAGTERRPIYLSM
jgi:hypothetical protein